MSVLQINARPELPPLDKAISYLMAGFYGKAREGLYEYCASQKVSFEFKDGLSDSQDCILLLGRLASHGEPIAIHRLGQALTKGGPKSTTGEPEWRPNRSLGLDLKARAAALGVQDALSEAARHLTGKKRKSSETEEEYDRRRTIGAAAFFYAKHADVSFYLPDGDPKAEEIKDHGRALADMWQGLDQEERTAVIMEAFRSCRMYRREADAILDNHDISALQPRSGQNSPSAPVLH